MGLCARRFMVGVVVEERQVLFQTGVLLCEGSVYRNVQICLIYSFHLHLQSPYAIRVTRSSASYKSPFVLPLLFLQLLRTSPPFLVKS